MVDETTGVLATSFSSKGSVSSDISIGEIGVGSIGNVGVAAGNLVSLFFRSDGESLG